MSTAHPTDPGLRVLASGAIVIVDDARRATLFTCDWLVRVPTNNPEPDFPEDCYRDVECGAKFRLHPELDDSFRCDRGHERIPYETACRTGRDLEWERDEYSYGERFWG